MVEVLEEIKMWVEDQKFTTAFRKMTKRLKAENCVVLDFEETGERKPAGRGRYEILYLVQYGRKLGKGKKAVE